MSSASWLSKLSFAWIYPVIKVYLLKHSTAIIKNLNKKILKIWCWRISHKPSTHSGNLIGIISIGSTQIILWENLFGKPSSVSFIRFRAISIRNDLWLFGISIYNFDPTHNLLYLQAFGRSSWKHDNVECNLAHRYSFV